MKTDDRQQIRSGFVMLTLMPKHFDVGALLLMAGGPAPAGVKPRARCERSAGAGSDAAQPRRTSLGLAIYLSILALINAFK